MPFDYTTKGWPSPITLNGNQFVIGSCDADDSGIVYFMPNTKNPHITIHGINKEGPDDWISKNNGCFHVRISNAKVFEYNRQGSADFEFDGKKKGQKATGNGSIQQAMEARTISNDFKTAIKGKIGYI